jgi:uncharacterized protein with NRDE domain
MCLIVLALGVHPRWPLLLLANRDEFHGRRSAPAAPWPEDPRVVGGRDLQAGGTWLACRSGGRFAAVANFRKPGAPPSRRSRGELPAAFALGDDPPEAFLTRLLPRLSDYAPFNLIVGDAREVWWLESERARYDRFPTGIHAVSNGPVGAPWPKCERAASALAALLAEGDASEEALLAILADRHEAREAELPDTGLSREQERFLSPVFIAGADYGTRASSLFRVEDQGCLFVERSFASRGAAAGEVRWWTTGSGWQQQPP